MTETHETQQPDKPHWAQRWDDVLAAREVRRQAALEAIHRFLSTVIDSHKMRIEARLQLARDLTAARFAFRRSLVRNAARRFSDA
jgi:hypothetical protein